MTSRSGRQEIIPTGAARLSDGRGQGVFIAYALMVAALMPDFRAQSGGSGVIFQMIFIFTHAAAFAAFLLLDRGERVRAPGFGLFIGLTGVFLGVGFGSGLARGQQLSEVLPVMLPTILYLTTGYATCRIVLTGDVAAVRWLLARLCLGYMVLAIVTERLAGGAIDFSQVRFQILSGATIPGIGYLECLLLFGLTTLELSALGGAGLIIFISVTRTFILVALVQLSTLIFGIRRLVSPRVIAVSVIGAVLALGALSMSSGGLERWTGRFTDNQSRSGEDFSFYTRQSEWTFMYESFLATTKDIAFGHGFAAHTVWYYPKEAGGGRSESTGFGHNQHLSLLFIGGVFGGAGLLILQFIQFFQSIMLLVRLSLRRMNSDLLFLGAWGATMIIGMVISNFLSSVLDNRGWGLWYGLGTGLFIGARARFKAMSAAAVPVATGGQPAPQPVRTGPVLPPAVARRRQALQARQGEASRA